MRGIHLREMPAWYDLRVIPSGIVLDIHPLAMSGFIRALLDLAELYTHIMGRSGPVANLPKFEMPGLGSSWGYVPCLRKRLSGTNSSGWTSYECLFPQTKPATDRTELLLCSATLRNVFEALNLVEAVSDWPKPQLINVDTLLAQSGMDGSFLSAEVSPTLARRIGQMTENEALSIRQAMRQTWNWIHPHWQEALGDFRIYYLDAESIHLDVPGNATGLDPEINHDLGEGYVLTGHNVDGPGQQLTLLAGVAKLNQLAREDGL